MNLLAIYILFGVVAFLVVAALLFSIFTSSGKRRVAH